MNSDNPYPTTSAPRAQVQERRDPSGSSSPPTIDDTNVHPSTTTLVGQRTYDVPGEAWIDPLEREGLPVHTPIPNAGGHEVGNILRRRSTWRRGESDADTTYGEKHIARLAEHQAAGVVRAHTRRGWGWLHRSRNDKKSTRLKEGEKGKATKHTRHRRHHTRSDTENDTDFTDGGLRRPGRVRKGVPGSWFSPGVHFPRTPAPHGRRPEEHHHRHHDGPKLGNGVLSTLLALYGHDHEHDDEGSMSGASSPGGRSRSSSDAGSEEGILPRPHQPWLPDQDGNNDLSTSKAQNDNHLGRSNLGRSVKGGSASSLLAHLRTPSLPAASTTAALIAGAGTLSGAAAPEQATLAPNLKRSGFNLVRYSMEEVPKTARRIPSVISRGFRRTRNTDSGVATERLPSEEKDDETESPDTPGGTLVVSPTLGSEGLVPSSEGERVSVNPVSTPGGRRGWTGKLKDLPMSMHFTPSHFRGLSSPQLGILKDKDFLTPGGSGTPSPRTASTAGTPVDDMGEKKEYFDLRHMEKEVQRIKEREGKERREREKRREKEIRRKRKRAEVYVRYLFVRSSCC